MSNTSQHAESSQPQWFVTTHWSVVMAAGRGDSTRARAALEKLCRNYWYPLYAFVRRLGHGAHDAEDLVQSFFAVCLEKNYLGAADEAKGRFRSFLLVALKRFLANEWDKSRTLKRGGAHTTISLDSLTAEQRYALEPAEPLTAEKLFERRWALTLLDQVIERLRAEQVAAGKREQFEQLKECITAAGRGTPYAELATKIGTSEGAIKVTVHRFRQRYRELLKEEIANTVASAEEIEEERRHLLAAFGKLDTQSSKLQGPNSREAPSPKLQKDFDARSHWDLKFGVSLALGPWSLELFFRNLSPRLLK